MAIGRLTEAEREAASIVDLFGTAIARGGIYSREAVLMAADYMESPSYGGDDGERVVIAAIAAWLREQAREE